MDCTGRVPLPLGALLSKLRDAIHSRGRVDAGFMGFSIWKPVPGMSLSLWGWREAPGEGRKCTLIRPFGPPFSQRGEVRASISANLDTSALGEGTLTRRFAAPSPKGKRDLAIYPADPRFGLLTRRRRRCWRRRDNGGLWGGRCGRENSGPDWRSSLPLRPWRPC